MSKALRLGSAQPVTPAPREFQLTQISHCDRQNTCWTKKLENTATHCETINQHPRAGATSVKINSHILGTPTCYRDSILDPTAFTDGRKVPRSVLESSIKNFPVQTIATSRLLSGVRIGSLHAINTELDTVVVTFSSNLALALVSLC